MKMSIPSQSQIADKCQSSPVFPFIRVPFVWFDEGVPSRKTELIEQK